MFDIFTRDTDGILSTPQLLTHSNNDTERNFEKHKAQRYRVASFNLVNESNDKTCNKFTQKITE